MKIQTYTARILIISLFFYILCIRSPLFVTSIDPCPLDVQVLYSDTSWCSGSYFVANSTYLWDITTITFVTFGIANLDIISHSLEQFLLTIDETTDEGGLKFLKADNLTSEANFPLLLSPQRYWMYNISCFTCQSLSKISLLIDDTWFTFYPHELISATGSYAGSTFWPPHWTNLSYVTKNSTASRIIPWFFFDIYASLGFFTVVSLFSRQGKGK